MLNSSLIRNLIYDVAIFKVAIAIELACKQPYIPS